MTTLEKGWADVCAAQDIVPGTGVCALVGGHHVAVFRLRDERVFAIGNVDPKSGASVLARGLVGNLGDRVVVASPLYKQHFDLSTGECLEEPAQSVPVYAAKIDNARVWVAA